MNALTRINPASMVIPDNRFASTPGKPKLASKNPHDVTGWCDLCGTIPPVAWQNGYTRRECLHQRSEREAAISRQTVAVGTRCYTWLGKQPGDLPGKSFDNFIPTHQAREYQQFKQHLADVQLYSVKIELGDTAGNLLLKGDYGVGKTHLSAAILNRLRGERIGGLFCTVRDLFEKLYTSDYDGQHSILAQASSTPVLVLDDLDKLYTRQETAGKYQKGILFDIIDKRYLARLSTIITTNADGDLSEWLNDATISRLRARLTTLNMHGIDYRAKEQR